MYQGLQTLPLNEHRVFCSTDIDEVIASVSQSYCNHHLVPKDKSAAIDARHHRFPLRGVSLNYLQYGAEVEIDPGSFDDFYMLEFPLAGQVFLEYGEDRVINRPGMAVVISPDRKIRSRWSSECAEIMVKINRRAMETSLCEAMGAVMHEPLEFTPAVSLDGPAGRAVRDYVAFVLRQADEGVAALGFDATRSALEKTLLQLMLTCLPHNYSDALAATRGGAMPYYVVRARRFIEANLQEAITVSDVLDHCGVSERILYGGFRRFLGVTPHRYIKNKRLEGVRRDLEVATSADKITDIAMKWGFTHLGRFSQDYARRFGERPSDTLRKF